MCSMALLKFLKLSTKQVFQIVEKLKYAKLLAIFSFHMILPLTKYIFIKTVLR